MQSLSQTSKCDGQEPVCGPCRDSGREAECTWGKETAKKARTQQHFESLMNHIKGLERRVHELEGELQHYRDPSAQPEAGPSGLTSSLSDKASPHAKSESDDADGQLDDPSSSSNEGSDIDKLIAPTRNLVLGERDLELYGPTSAFRLAPDRPSECSCPREDCVHKLEQSPVPVSPYIDWTRHLPPECPLIRDEHDRLLDLFFKFFSSWCMRLIPEYFLRDMRRALSLPASQPALRTAHYSPMLHNSILALATAFSDDPMKRAVSFRAHFARKAKSYIDHDCEKPSIACVSSLSLLGSYHATNGEQGLGYFYFGMSGRMAQALGLGVDPSPWVKSGRIKQSDAIDRHWAYWETVTQDVCWSLYVGRDRCFIHQKGENSRSIPVPLVGSDIDRAPWHCEPAKFPLQTSNVASVFAATCELMHVAERVLAFVNGLGNVQQSRMQIVSELDIELNAWKDSLPPEIDLTASTRPVALPHRLTLHLAYWWMLILLHRPFYRRTKSDSSGIDIDHVKLANRAAENIMMIATSWHNNFSLRFCPLTIVQIVFSAGTVFVLSAIQAISGPRLGRVTLLASLRQIKQCMEYLDEIGESWICAHTIKSILINLLDIQLKPRLQLRSGETGFKSPIVSPSTPQEQSQEHDQPRRMPTIHPILPNHSPGSNKGSPPPPPPPSAGSTSNMYTASVHAGEWPMNMMDAVRDAMSTMSNPPPSNSMNATPPLQPPTNQPYNNSHNQPFSHMNQNHQNSSFINPDNDTLMNLNMGSSNNNNMRVDSRGLGMDLGISPFYGSFQNQGVPVSYMPLDSPFPPMDLDSLPFVGGTMPMIAGQEPTSSAAVDFSEEELAIMEQLYRQQQMQQANNNMMFGRS
ncbi:unnamed protein product [Somion occarium]|uniref:Xylanolytic transcriptional activator regulatory domain-containing protein n=1 Tax=Somion occarium TaxID=3059160 RepID=A0ABP1CW85_9APHY